MLSAGRRFIAIISVTVRGMSVARAAVGISSSLQSTSSSFFNIS
jgi:hypothetical protein